MRKGKPSKILKSRWMVVLFALLLGGGYNLVSGSRTASETVLAVANTPTPEAMDDEEESELELATFMGQLQTMAHKLNLSIVAENPELSGFYLHEVEEVLEQIEALFPQHDGFPVGEMVTSFALRALDPVEEGLLDEDWSYAARSYERFVESCNGCHDATGHPFIEIVTTSMNPFNQNFGRY